MKPEGGPGRARGFLTPRAELRGYAAFGFVLPSYRRRGATEVQRIPTARATLYFARDVRLDPSSTARFSGVFCEGPRASSFTVPSECRELVAVKVSPGGLRALLGVPAREIRGQTVSLEDVWGKRARELTDRLLSAKTVDERFQLLEEELAARCRSFSAHDDTALRVARAIERRRGQLTIGALCDATGLAQRTLLSRFDEWVGLTPKQLARAARLRSVLARLAPDGHVAWAELALDCGYFDQAHLIHEFNELLGMSPGVFLERRRTFSPAGAPAFGKAAIPRREQSIYRTLGLVSTWVGQTTHAQNSVGVRANSNLGPAEIYNPPPARTR